MFDALHGTDLLAPSLARPASVAFGLTDAMLGEMGELSRALRVADA